MKCLMMLLFPKARSEGENRIRHSCPTGKGEDGSEERKKEQKKYREDFIRLSGFAALSGAFLLQISLASRELYSRANKARILEAQLP